MKAWPHAAQQWASRRLSVRLRLTLASAALLLPSIIGIVLPIYMTRRPLSTSACVALGQNTFLGMGLAVVTWWALVLALSSAGAYWLAGWALRPVREISLAAKRINAGTLDTRLAFAGPPGEFKQLADAVDQMLGRLEHAFELQKRFVADAAHELRTPLATLRANLEVVRSDAKATLEDYLTMSAVLERTLTRLERLVADLLLLMRNELNIVMEEVALGPLVEDVLLLHEPLAEEKAVTLRLTGDGEVTVSGDGPLLARVVGNLVENGICYNRAGGTVAVTMGRDGTQAIITVTDTGLGISPKEQAHLFERFYRAESSRSRYSRGSGLGLSIVAHVVKLHDGTIEVTSVPGVGSTFTMRLPLWVAPSPFATPVRHLPGLA